MQKTKKSVVKKIFSVSCLLHLIFSHQTSQSLLLSVVLQMFIEADPYFSGRVSMFSIA